jgi:hypothetical protein
MVMVGGNNKKGKNDDVLKEWNPLHIAIFYEHFKLIEYFCLDLKINVRTSLKMPGSKVK